MTRRDSIRLGLLALLGPVLAACGEATDDGSRGERSAAGGEPELMSSDRSRSGGLPEAAPETAAALQTFSGRLYGGLAGTGGNLVLSPYSIAVALAMTLAGATGRTAQEMRSVLGVSNEDRFHGGLNALSVRVEGLAGPQQRADGTAGELVLDAANQLFGQRGVEWQSDFLDLLAEEYGAGMRVVDFRSATEEARGAINGWVAERTRDRIPEVIPPGVLDELSRLVLVNALYLRAPWEYPFERAMTGRRPFRRTDGSAVTVDMMRKADLRGALSRGEGWQAARLPYVGGGLAMTVVLPDPGRMDALESALAGGGVGELLSSATPTILDLELPKWRFRTQAPLNEVLASLGMPTAFDQVRADFTPMTVDDLDLYLSAVLHEGFIAVDEDGTEAAAATASIVNETSAPVAEPFHVDRPFLFVIHDVEHGTPLFVGRVDDPTA